MSRFHFSLSDMFLAVTLIGAGFGGIAFAEQFHVIFEEFWVVVMWLVSAGFIGAGVGTIFRRWDLGALYGVALAVGCAVIAVAFLLARVGGKH